MSILLRRLTRPECYGFRLMSAHRLHIHQRLARLSLDLLACGLYLQWVRAIDRSADHVVFKCSPLFLAERGWIAVPLEGVVAAVDEHATLLSNQFLALDRHRNLA